MRVGLRCLGEVCAKFQCMEVQPITLVGSAGDPSPVFIHEVVAVPSLG